jgi:uncharacterized membrane protein YhaH (DUF805 family)
MPILQVLFSFEGRINRSQFWLGTVLALCASLAAGRWLLSPLLATQIEVWRIELRYGQPGLNLPLALILTSLASLAWVHAAVIVKRCRDRGKSDGWAFLALVPIIGFVWLVIDLGCLPGRRLESDLPGVTKDFTPEARRTPQPTLHSLPPIAFRNSETLRLVAALRALGNEINFSGTETFHVTVRFRAGTSRTFDSFEAFMEYARGIRANQESNQGRAEVGRSESELI